MIFDFMTKNGPSLIEAIVLMSPWIFNHLLVRWKYAFHPLEVFRWKVGVNKWFWRLSGITASILIVLNLKSLFFIHATCMFIYLSIMMARDLKPIVINRYNADSFLTYAIDFIEAPTATYFYDFVMEDLKGNIDTLIDIIEGKKPQYKGAPLLCEKVYAFFEVLCRSSKWDTFMHLHEQKEKNNGTFNTLPDTSDETERELYLYRFIESENKRKVLESIFYTEKNPYNVFMDGYIGRIVNYQF
jgi:hypothetical protein